MPHRVRQPNDERVIVCTPTGRDAILTEAALAATGLCVECCRSIDDACERIRVGAVARLVVNEALTPHAQARLVRALAEQPTWSDIPVSVLTGGPVAATRNMPGDPLLMANVTLLERPVRRAVLVSAVQTARRARERQYEVRDHLAERARHEAELTDAARREHDLRTEAQAARARLETVLRGITDGLFIVDGRWCFTYANAAAATLHRKSPQALLESWLTDVYPELHDSAEWSLLVRAMESRTTVQFDWYWASAARWCHWRVYPAPEGLAVFSADVTDRKTAEHETRAYLERQENIAETLQRSLLGAAHSYEGIEIASCYEAAFAEAKIGGDFYDEFLVDESRVALVVGDVVGKGLAAAAHTAEVKFALRAILREDPRTGVAMERLNSYLVDAQRLDDAPHDKLVALSLAVWDRSTGYVSASLAASEAPLVVSPGGEISFMGAHGLVLGAKAKSEYETTTRPLTVGYTLVMLTDGITEARKNKEFYGIDGVLQAIQSAGGKRRLVELGEAIVAGAKTFAGGALRDDACVLLARIKG